MLEDILEWQNRQQGCLRAWTKQSEGARFWLAVINEHKNRGLRIFLSPLSMGLKGFPKPSQHVFANAEIQTCIVQLMRNSLSYCNLETTQGGSSGAESSL
ncbi:MAG: transposase [Verrucomicrobia bacterium]|nr:transposase [Verrucomicrobiota bacterium]